MRFRELTAGFLAVALMGQQAALGQQSAWWLSNETVPAFGGEQRLKNPPQPFSSYSGNIIDNDDLDPKIRCVATSLMREKKPDDIFIAYTKPDGRWSVDLINKTDLNVRIGISLSFDNALQIYNASASQMVKTVFRDDLSVQTQGAKSPSDEQNMDIAARARRCLSIS